MVADQRLKFELVSGFLRHNVHDAHHCGVVLDDTGRPTEASLAILAGSPETEVITVNGLTALTMCRLLMLVIGQLARRRAALDRA